MVTTAEYTFRAVTPADAGLLGTWQAAAHVRAWWDASEGYDAAQLADPRVARWIVSMNGRPFGFMQDYTVHGWDSHHFADLPEGSRGIDQYIGDPEMLGLGHGIGFIRARMDMLFAEGAPVIATDPHPDNARAIAVYRRLGFVPSGAAQHTQWGLILPMLARTSADRAN